LMRFAGLISRPRLFLISVSFRGAAIAMNTVGDAAKELIHLPL